MPLNRQAVKLADLVNEIVRLQQALAHSRKAILQNRVEPDLPLIWVDADLIRRVLQNLVGNTIKFALVGGVISIDARPVDSSLASEVTEEATGYLVVTVQDNGPSLPAKTNGRPFEKPTPGRLLEQGRGLGLAFCRLAVEAHGGRIWIEGQPGQGTTFQFTVPIIAD